MRNLVVKNSILLSLLIVFIVGNSFAANSVKDAIGSWNYKAPSAPYEYASGKLIFTKSGDKLEGKIKIGEYEIEMRNVKSEKETVSFGAYVEGEYIDVKINIKKKNNQMNYQIMNS